MKDKKAISLLEPAQVIFVVIALVIIFVIYFFIFQMSLNQEDTYKFSLKSETSNLDSSINLRNYLLTPISIQGIELTMADLIKEAIVENLNGDETQITEVFQNENQILLNQMDYVFETKDGNCRKRYQLDIKYNFNLELEEVSWKTLGEWKSNNPFLTKLAETRCIGYHNDYQVSTQNLDFNGKDVAVTLTSYTKKYPVDND